MDIPRPSLKHLFLLTQIAGNVPSAVKNIWFCRSKHSWKCLLLVLQKTLLLSPLKRLEMSSGVLKNIQWSDSNSGCLVGL